MTISKVTKTDFKYDAGSSDYFTMMTKMNEIASAVSAIANKVNAFDEHTQRLERSVTALNQRVDSLTASVGEARSHQNYGSNGQVNAFDERMQCLEQSVTALNQRVDSLTASAGEASTRPNKS